MIIVWMIATYFMVREIKKNNPQIKINEWLYVLGTCLFGFLGTMGYLGYRVSDSRGNERGKVVSVIAIIIAVIINIVYLIGLF